jgi:hypothetical protein
MTAAEQSRILERYCESHRCVSCPVNVAQLGCGDPEDLCVVSLALNELARVESEVSS